MISTNENTTTLVLVGLAVALSVLAVFLGVDAYQYCSEWGSSPPVGGMLCGVRVLFSLGAWTVGAMLLIGLDISEIRGGAPRGRRRNIYTRITAIAGGFIAAVVGLFSGLHTIPGGWIVEVVTTGIALGGQIWGATHHLQSAYDV